MKPIWFVGCQRNAIEITCVGNFCLVRGPEALAAFLLVLPGGLGEFY